MNCLIINISQVLAKLGERKQFKKTETFSPIQISDGFLKFSTPVNFDFCVESIRAGAQVSGNIEAGFYLTCCRCLQKFSYSVQVKINELFRKYGKEEELPPEGERFEIANECIDIGRLTEQALLLALPVKILCSKNCKGLCPRCGKNLNQGKCQCKQEEIDPRLSKLKDLL